MGPCSCGGGSLFVSGFRRPFGFSFPTGCTCGAAEIAATTGADTDLEVESDRASGVPLREPSPALAAFLASTARERALAASQANAEPTSGLAARGGYMVRERVIRGRAPDADPPWAHAVARAAGYPLPERASGRRYSTTRPAPHGSEEAPHGSDESEQTEESAPVGVAALVARRDALAESFPDYWRWTGYRVQGNTEVPTGRTSHFVLTSDPAQIAELRGRVPETDWVDYREPGPGGGSLHGFIVDRTGPSGADAPGIDWYELPMPVVGSPDYRAQLTAYVTALQGRFAALRGITEATTELRRLMAPPPPPPPLAKKKSKAAALGIGAAIVWALTK